MHVHVRRPRARRVFDLPYVLVPFRGRQYRGRNAGAQPAL